ncbi:MAG: ABC transporter permease [Planctomycetota bacterium]
MDPSRPATAPAIPYYQPLLGFRYLRSRRSAVAAFLAVAFGVAVIVVVLSIMGGYVQRLREIIRGQEAHIHVVGDRPFAVARIARLERAIRKVDGVRAVAPILETPAMYRAGRFSPCYVRGILPEKQWEVSAIGECVFRPGELEAVLGELGVTGDSEARAPANALRDSEAPLAATVADRALHARSRKPLSAGELADLFSPRFSEEVLSRHNPSVYPDVRGEIPPACLVGIHLLLNREVFLGQVLTIVTLKARTFEPVHGQFLVAGAFKTGDYTADSKTIYAHVDALKNLLDLYDPETNSFRYDGVRVAVSDLRAIEKTKAAIERALRDDKGLAGQSLFVRTWEELRKNLLSAVEIERSIIYFLLLLLVAFTGCMVFLMALLTVIEKTRDIGILVALGATPKGVVRVFLAKGLMISAAGCLGGLILGYAFCAFVNPIHDWIYAQTGLRLFPVEIYHMDRIPTTFRPLDVVLSVGPALVFGFTASLFPAAWASHRDPIKAIHYE